MADSTHANYGRIGFTVVAGLVAIIATLIYLGGISGIVSHFFDPCFKAGPDAWSWST